MQEKEKLPKICIQWQIINGLGLYFDMKKVQWKQSVNRTKCQLKMKQPWNYPEIEFYFLLPDLKSLGHPTRTLYEVFQNELLLIKYYKYIIGGDPMP